MSALRTWRTILAATGVHASLLPVAVALVVTLVWRDGTIVAIGPLTLAAKLPVVVAVPTLLAVACAISHVPMRTPVVIRNVRTVTARAISHLTLLGAGLVVVAVGEVVSPESTAGPALRNLAVLGAAALVTAAFAGPVYAWVPVLVIFGLGVLSNPDDATWSIHALLMAPTVEGIQLGVMIPACLGAVVLAALDPLNHAYLPRHPVS